MKILILIMLSITAYSDEIRIYKNKITGGKLISEYGERIDPFTKNRTFHRGHDYAAKKNTPVKIEYAGLRVVKIFRDSVNGKTIHARYKNTFDIYFIHLNKIYVKKNERIASGKIIGLVGNTGRAKGYHLHVTYKLFKKTVSPRIVLDKYDVNFQVVLIDERKKEAK